MHKSHSFASFLLASVLFACGGPAEGPQDPPPDNGAGGSQVEGAPGCAPGGQPPEAGPDGVPENCAVLFEGCCYADASDACRAAGCGDACEVMESYPGQVARCEPAPSCPEGGEPPVTGPDGLPQNCAVLYEGCCFADSADACRAADCPPEDCIIAMSYPGQLGRCE